MRILEFDVNNQEILKNALCDFSKIERNTKGIAAKFNFSREWNDHKIVVSFFKLGEEYPMVLKNGMCRIPDKALTWKEFFVQVTGIKDETMLKTNRLSIKQEG